MEQERKVIIGVLSLQGAFEEHQQILESLGCETIQVKTPDQLNGIDGIVFPGGESTAMGLIGSSNGIWDELKKTVLKSNMPTWGTCAGMILLAERCVGTSAVIENGQSLIGGMDVLVCRNYFGSQVSSFEMNTPPPPGCEDASVPYPGVFIRAPAILLASEEVEVLGKVLAKPCNQAAATLHELDEKIANGETVIKMSVVDSLNRNSGIPRRSDYVCHDEEKKEEHYFHQSSGGKSIGKALSLPSTAEGSLAREVICVVRKNNILCTAFHPELTTDLRWHKYFLDMVTKHRGAKSSD